MEIDILLSLFKVYAAQEHVIKTPESLYEPVQYLMDLKGKRIRPLLALMAYNLYKDDVDEVMPVAYAIELFHNFTLMHDDIMDEATLRRGGMAVHQKYGVNAGILSGDAMLLLAYKYLFKSGLGLKEVEQFNNIALEICEGQQMDMNFESQKDVTIEAYLEMIKLKTAILLGLAMELGAVKAGASESDIQHLYKFGVNMGIAFQLHDDMLDAFGSSSAIGKKQGGDIMQRKQTYLHLKTLELLGDEERVAYLDVFNDFSIDDELLVEKVLSYYDQAVVKEYSLQSEEAYFVLAMSHLDAVNVSADKKSELKKLAHSLMERAH